MDYLDSTLFYEVDAFWIVLIAAGIFMFLSSIVTIIVLCFLWRRSQKSRKLNNNNNTTPIPVQIDHRPLENYETQRMEIFVPPDEDDTTQRNLGEFYARITPQDGIQQMHQFYQRTNKAYF